MSLHVEAMKNHSWDQILQNTLKSVKKLNNFWYLCHYLVYFQWKFYIYLVPYHGSLFEIDCFTQLLKHALFCCCYCFDASSDFTPASFLHFLFIPNLYNDSFAKSRLSSRFGYRVYH